ncbi:MAG TPA: SpoIIE family protein phosphatase [Candidatus Cloacimonadota bacterium]|nr:SpoIIE family protein phosphatase [Candidatus Cloacimonadota bacterium]
MLRKIRIHSLTYQLIGFFSIFLLAILLTSLILTRVLMSRVMMKNAKNNVTAVAQLNINRIEGSLRKIENQATNVCYLEGQNLLRPSETDDMIEKLLETSPDLVSVCIARDPASSSLPAKIYYKSGSAILQHNLDAANYAYQDWFQIPYETGEARWTEPWFDFEGNHKLVSSYSIPFSSNSGQPGVLRLDLALAALQNLVMPTDQNDLGYMFMISGNGTIVAHPADSLVMNESIFSLAESRQDPQLRRIGQDMIRGGSGTIQLIENTPQKKDWITYAPLKSNGWSLAVVVPNARIFKDLQNLLVTQFGIFVLAFLLLSLVIVLRTIHINKPLTALTTAAARLGEGNFDIDLPQATTFSELAQLSQSFNNMKDSLKNYIQNLKQTTDEKNRIMSEVLFASTIQRKLIPSNPEHSIFQDRLRIHGILEPAGDIGGDLYDYFMIDKDTFCFGIADVVGKGIVAAMTMTMVSTHLRAKGSYHSSPDTLLADLNKFLCENNIEANFVTMILGMVNLHTGKLSFSNAGHVPLYIRKADRSYTKYSDTHSTALGVFPDMEIGYQTAQLDLGDEIILFTDGITESMTRSESFFGIQRLEEVIQGLQNPNAETTAKAILAGARKFSDTENQYDDITILVIDYLHP